ncbi:hypothetical protein Bbelb_360030 [Branchiostoma belcheri]|nr:hypothetical protein Bbelb_360030 [Branchiostoma belcheri]
MEMEPPRVVRNWSACQEESNLVSSLSCGRVDFLRGLLELFPARLSRDPFARLPKLALRGELSPRGLSGQPNSPPPPGLAGAGLLRPGKRVLDSRVAPTTMTMPQPRDTGYQAKRRERKSGAKLGKGQESGPRYVLNLGLSGKTEAGKEFHSLLVLGSARAPAPHVASQRASPGPEPAHDTREVPPSHRDPRSSNRPRK